MGMEFKDNIDHLPWEPITRNAIYALYDKRDGLIRYCGQTTRAVGTRFRHHLTLALSLERDLERAVKKSQPVTHWIVKHGRENIGCLLLESVDGDQAALDAAEEFWIQSLGTYTDPQGLNLRPGGKNTSGWKMPEEQKRKIGEANRGRTGNLSPEARAALAKRMSERRGSANYGSVLTEEKVLQIKQLLFAGDSHKDIAERFGVTSSSISNIFLGKTWTHVPKPIGPYPKRFGQVAPLGDESYNHKLSEALVSDIKRSLWNGEFPTDLAKSYGVSISTICYIEDGKSWTNVPWPIGPRVQRDTYARVAQRNRKPRPPSPKYSENAKASGRARSVLSMDDARAIREMRNAGMGYEEIQNQLGIAGVSIGMIGKIVRNERWVE